MSELRQMATFNTVTLHKGDHLLTSAADEIERLCAEVERLHDKGIGNVLTWPREEPVDHPSPKPETLMQQLLQVVTKPGDLVLDPFMGSGTTLRAAKNTGRRAIGIESVEAYCEVAARRLAQEVLAL